MPKKSDRYAAELLGKTSRFVASFAQSFSEPRWHCIQEMDLRKKCVDLTHLLETICGALPELFCSVA